MKKVFLLLLLIGRIAECNDYNYPPDLNTAPKQFPDINYSVNWFNLFEDSQHGASNDSGLRTFRLWDDIALKLTFDLPPDESINDYINIYGDGEQRLCINIKTSRADGTYTLSKFYFDNSVDFDYVYIKLGYLISEGVDIYPGTLYPDLVQRRLGRSGTINIDIYPTLATSDYQNHYYTFGSKATPVIHKKYEMDLLFY